MHKEEDEQLEVIDGLVERIIFLSDRDAYAVVSIKSDDTPEPFVAVGDLMGVVPGEGLRLWGRWEHKSRYGVRFSVNNYVTRLPASLKAIEKYLSSGLIKGIGPVYAGRIVEHFGKDTIDIIDKEPERLLEVEGIGRKRLEMITSTWRRQLRIRELMLFLQEHGISASLGRRIHRFYGDASIEILNTNPYQLVIDIHGIGFKSADQIAARLGLTKDSPQRIQAGVLHELDQARVEGHTYLPEQELVERARTLLDVDPAAIERARDELAALRKIVVTSLPSGKTGVFLSGLYTCERQVAEAVNIISKTGKFLPRIDADHEIARYEESANFTFAEEQKRAIRKALRGGVVVITGGPGTGKTTIMRALLHILETHGVRVKLASPTGRAANRLSETTGKPAATLHRLLKFDPAHGTFEYNGQNPLPTDFLIVDEASMLDIRLAHKVMVALAPVTSIVLVGDVDQLPAVGAGNFLEDLICSNKVPVIRFTEIFRQARWSRIIVNAHRINQGKFPYLRPKYNRKRLGDFFFIQRNEPEEALRTMKVLIQERIPEKFGFHPIEDIQVISPMYRGVLGVSNINTELQELLNPGRDVFIGGLRRFRIGDKIIQQRNNYDKDVFNGDVGVIETIDREYQTVKVRFGNRIVPYDPDEMDQLSLAYAISVHKAQGSEYKALVLPVHTQHYIMLQRNLLYTAITRAEKLVCVIGTKQAVAIAVKNDKERQRHSALCQWLRE